MVVGVQIWKIGTIKVRRNGSLKGNWSSVKTSSDKVRNLSSNDSPATQSKKKKVEESQKWIFNMAW